MYLGRGPSIVLTMFSFALENIVEVRIRAHLFFFEQENISLSNRLSLSRQTRLSQDAIELC